MQTFVTFKDWARTAQSLNNKHCGKQRLEALQTMRQLIHGEGGYPHHPVNLMWRGYEYALGVYGMQVSMEWHTHRRFADTIFFEFKREIEFLRTQNPDVAFASPPWRADADVMRSHRSNLVRKEKEGMVPEGFYSKKFPGQSPDWAYLWPVVDKDDPSQYELRVSKADLQRIKDGERMLPANVAERVVNL